MTRMRCGWWGVFRSSVAARIGEAREAKPYGEVKCKSAHLERRIVGAAQAPATAARQFLDLFRVYNLGFGSV